MKVLQVLPALNSGGVERGTVEFARELVKRGHESWVLSNGGRLVEQLEAEGSKHIRRPVHKKSLVSLTQVRPVRQLLKELKPDVVHVRSRLPAWIIYLAWRKLPANDRPKLVSTFHGMYSVNAYSAVMAKAEHIIAISETVKQYIRKNYDVPDEKISLIHRGVDTEQFKPEPPSTEWLSTLYSQFPELEGKKVILMPGRLTRWKGQEDFLHMMQRLVKDQPHCHGVILGGAEASKEHFLDELKTLRKQLGLENNITLVGQRSDIAEFYNLATVVCHMSQKPEPFGRTLTEALATNTPVVAWDRGGAAESLRQCYPSGLVTPDSHRAFCNALLNALAHESTITVPSDLTLATQVSATLIVYQST